MIILKVFSLIIIIIIVIIVFVQEIVEGTVIVVFSEAKKMTT